MSVDICVYLYLWRLARACQCACVRVRVRVHLRLRLRLCLRGRVGDNRFVRCPYLCLCLCFCLYFLCLSPSLSVFAGTRAFVTNKSKLNSHGARD